MEKLNKKTTLILGASTKPNRYAYLAAQRLIEAGHPILLVAKRKGQLFGLDIHDNKVNFENIDTITLYLNPTNQKEYYDYLVKLKPQRIIFNPGTENEELYDILKENNINYIEACTLVLLSIDKY